MEIDKFVFKLCHVPKLKNIFNEIYYLYVCMYVLYVWSVMTKTLDLPMGVWNE